MLDKQRIIRFHAALAAANLKWQKENMLHSCGVDSTKDLTAAQADQLIARLNAIVEEKEKVRAADIRKHRSVVLTLVNKLGIYITNDDWSMVNKFLLQPRIAGKFMYEMNVEEMKALQKKLRGMIRQREKEVQEIKYLETNN